MRLHVLSDLHLEFSPFTPLIPADADLVVIAGDTLPAGYSFPMPRLMGALAATGVILGAVYLLYMFQKVFFGKLDKSRNGGLPDLKTHELITFVILSVAILLGGLFPRPALQVMEPSVQKFVHAPWKHTNRMSHWFVAEQGAPRLPQLVQLSHRPSVGVK